MAASQKQHPCLSCGACCASFRVSFYWREAEPGESIWGTPFELTQDLDSRYRCMKGTDRRHNIKCIALKGKIGKEATCSIYENRPSPCRAFEASYSKGKHNLRCDEARAKHGLKPLGREDYLDIEQEKQAEL